MVQILSVQTKLSRRGPGVKALRPSCIWHALRPLLPTPAEMVKSTMLVSVCPQKGFFNADVRSVTSCNDVVVGERHFPLTLTCLLHIGSYKPWLHSGHSAPYTINTHIYITIG